MNNFMSINFYSADERNKPLEKQLTKTDTKKENLQINITEEHRCKNPQQTESKSTLKGSYTMIKWGLSQECKDSSIYANQSM